MPLYVESYNYYKEQIAKSKDTQEVQSLLNDFFCHNTHALLGIMVPPEHAYFDRKKSFKCLLTLQPVKDI